MNDGFAIIMNHLFRSTTFYNCYICRNIVCKISKFLFLKNVTLNILFHLQYRSLAPMYYRGASAAIIVYDITREVSVRLYW